MSKRWYVAQTKTKLEEFAASELAKQHFETFFPTYQQRRKIAGKPEVVRAPVFPNYLFVAFDTNCDRWRAINGTKGIVKLLGNYDEFVCPVKDGVIETMKNDYQSGYFETQLGLKRLQQYVSGDKLRVLSGPFAGSVGRCALASKNKISIILSLLSGNVVVSMKAESVARA